MNLWLLLETIVSMHPDRRAITEDGFSLTFKELERRAKRRAAWLAQHAAGRPVLYVGQNRLEFVELLFAAVAAGLPLVPVNFRVKASEYEHFLRVSGARVAFAEIRYHELLNQTAEQLGTTLNVQPLDAGVGAEDYEIEWVDADAPAVCLFTSGTTSAPKLVRLSHANLSSYVIETVPAGSANVTEAAILSAPAYHVAAVANILTTLFRGRRLVLLAQFDARSWLEVVQREGVTHAMLVPTMLSRVLDAIELDPKLVPTCLESIAYGGAKASPDLIERALQRFPTVDFVNAFGLTETSSTVALLSPEDHRSAIESDDPAVRARLRSVGRPVPGTQIEIRREDGSVADAGEPGQICIKGAQVTTGYVGAELDIDQDGWLRTGDVGYVDDQQYLFIADRSDDIIIRGGENISPGEIEDVLLRHPAIRDVAVVGLPDSEWGEIVAAAFEGEALVEQEELQDWVRQHLAGFKVPVRIERVESLPRNDMGKLVRTEVRRQLGT